MGETGVEPAKAEPDGLQPPSFDLLDTPPAPVILERRTPIRRRGRRSVPCCQSRTRRTSDQRAERIFRIGSRRREETNASRSRLGRIKTRSATDRKAGRNTVAPLAGEPLNR